MRWGHAFGGRYTVYSGVRGEGVKRGVVVEGRPLEYWRDAVELMIELMGTCESSREERGRKGVTLPEGALDDILGRAGVEGGTREQPTQCLRRGIAAVDREDRRQKRLGGKRLVSEKLALHSGRIAGQRGSGKGSKSVDDTERSQVVFGCIRGVHESKHESRRKSQRVAIGKRGQGQNGRK